MPSDKSAVKFPGVGNGDKRPALTIGTSKDVNVMSVFALLKFDGIRWWRKF